MTKKHIAASGKRAGEWVTCDAKQNCTLTSKFSSAKFHTTAAELILVQQYMEDQTGEKVGCYMLPLKYVLEYKILSESAKEEIASKVKERLEKARKQRAEKQTRSSKLNGIKNEVSYNPPAVIDVDTLNKNSYLMYGFSPSENGSEYFHSEIMTEKESIAESMKDLAQVSSVEKKALVYFSTENYEWINEALYENKKLPSVKGSRADFGIGQVESEITSVNVGDKFSDNPYVTPQAQRTKEFLAEAVSTLDNAMAKAPRRKSRLLYRGIQPEGTLGNGLPVKEWVSTQGQIGNKITFDGYQSTASSFQTASDTYASDDGSVIFEIRTPEGLNISSISSYSEEQEVLLPRKSSYIIVGKHEVTRKRGKKATVLQLVAVNNSNEVLTSENHMPISAPLKSVKKNWISSLFSKG